jgi:long-subunit acyl-CoA synthetase (AMP-forming)
MVYGPSTSSFLIAVVVPEWDVLLNENKNNETNAENWGNGIVKRYWEGVKNPEKISDILKKEEKKKRNSKNKKKNSTLNIVASSPSLSSSPPPPPSLSPPSSLTITTVTYNESTNAMEETEIPLNLRLYLAEDIDLKSFIISAIQKSCESNNDKIRKFEIPKGVVVCGETWCDTNKCLTPSMKIKRDVIKNKYKEAFQVELVRVENIQENQTTK